jgi:insecticidal toxin complex protein TccC
MFDPALSIQERLIQASKPVLLAGHIYFTKIPPPQKGTGELISWNINSGHYQPSYNNAVNNRIGFIKKLLPIDKFMNSFP